MLFVNPENLMFQSTLGKFLIDKREMFLSKQLKKKFLGYAFSQKHKMIIRTDKFHEFTECLAYLKELDPKEVLITLKEKRLPFLQFKRNHFHCGDIQLEKNIFVSKAIKILQRRVDAVGNRKDLILARGYDTKFAHHLIRLMFEGISLLKHNHLEFPFSGHERDILMDIKLGKWKLKEVLDLSEKLEKEVESLAELSNLPNSSYNEVNCWVIDIMHNFVGQHGVL